LQRYSQGRVIDELELEYDGNQLSRVFDAAGGQNRYYLKEYQDKATQSIEMEYDANGNLVKDLDRNILSIKYNLLNLPSEIIFEGGHKIFNIYSANGQKLESMYLTQRTLTFDPLEQTIGDVSNISEIHGSHYFGNIEYEYNDLHQREDPKLLRIHNAEGYYSDNQYYYYRRDHLGNNREVWRVADNKTVQITHYYPSGLPWATTQEQNPDLQPYKYNGKEFVEDYGYDSFDYGARMRDGAVPRFETIDPLCERYYSFSPYAYCGNNPIMYIDPNGMKIDSLSPKEWNKQKNNIIKNRDKLQNRINNLTARAEKRGWSAEKLAGKIGNKQERTNSLNGTLSNLSTLEGSTQVYALKKISGEVGGTYYDKKTGNIVFSFDGTANFVHETTHGGQFEAGDLAFDSKSGRTVGQDVFDEVAAYQAQYAYSPYSVSELPSTSVVNSFNTITPSWVQGLEGGTLYVPGGDANTGLTPLNINSTKADFIKAYPNNPVLMGFPANFILKTSYPNLYYKR
jgi:RHS repeat-associated protein